ncbi:hypothetical protein NY551_18990 [Curtobacterium flaccumfaciens pv. oortii]|uniref:hypothetical protein n=1 Tax=Curtobacterium flaccumfaciens TaxID=2035 RepID=UPI00265A6318|nr:hypothetical protein [Curtobacterium flaccumfaciens]MCS5524827.1 hypothetical protein [Curtobacterium flaccumfaciens pv. oortii]
MLVTFQKAADNNGQTDQLVTVNLDHVVRLEYIEASEDTPEKRVMLVLTNGSSPVVYFAPADADSDEIAQRLSDLEMVRRGSFDALAEPVWPAPKVS